MSKVTRRQLLAGAGASALVLAGCGSDDDDAKNADLSSKRAGAMDNYGAGVQFKATEPLKFSILMLSNPNYPFNKDWPFLTELTKRTNVSFEATVVPFSDYNQKRSVMVSAGNAPFIIPKTYHPQEEPYIAGGAVLPVSDYLDLMPNFKAKIEKWNLKADLDQLRQSDGKFYLLPGLHEDVWLDYSLAVRTDILKKLNLEIPKTWDDIYNMLKEMKKLQPTSYPFSDRWSTPPEPGANCLLRTVSESFGTWAGWLYQNAYWDAKAGKFVVTGAMDEYRQLCEFLNKLVTEKLLDPESFTQSDDQARQKFASGKSYVISANAQELVNNYRKDLASVPGATVQKIPLPIGPRGPVKEGSRLENGIVISKKALQSKNFVAMMQFIDWLWYSDEGQMLAKWGIEGTTYTGKIDDGSFKLMPDVTFGGINPTGKKKLQVDYGFFNGVFAYGGSTKLLNSQFSAEELEFQKVMGERETVPVAPAHPLTPEEREQATLWESGMKDFVNQQTLRFILGQRPLSEWDAYVTELKGKNSQQYIDLVNKAHERFNKEHG